MSKKEHSSWLTRPPVYKVVRRMPNGSIVSAFSRRPLLAKYSPCRRRTGYKGSPVFVFMSLALAVDWAQHIRREERYYGLDPAQGDAWRKGKLKECPLIRFYPPGELEVWRVDAVGVRALAVVPRLPIWLEHCKDVSYEELPHNWSPARTAVEFFKTRWSRGKRLPKDKSGAWHYCLTKAPKGTYTARSVRLMDRLAVVKVEWSDEG